MIPSEGRITFIHSVLCLENLNTIYKAIIETSPSGLFWNVFLNITDVNLFNIYKVTVDLNLFSVDFFFQRTEDTPVLLTKNEIKALKKLVFSAV